MTNAILNYHNSLHDVSLSFKSIDVNHQKFILIITSNSINLSFPVSDVICKYDFSKSNGTYSVFIKSPTLEDTISITFHTESEAKKLYSFILTKSDSHHADEMMDSMDKAVQFIWPFPNSLVSLPVKKCE